MQLPFVSRRGAERTEAMLKEQYKVDLSQLREEDEQFRSDFSKALSNEFKAITFNYIASQVNYIQFHFQDYTLNRLITELYLRDSVVASCTLAYQMHYPEPQKLVYVKDKEVTNTELNQLIKRPNPWMTDSVLDRHIVSYQLWTGNAYLLKLYEDNGQIGQLFPFSGLNMYPVPGLYDFIEYFQFLTAEGNTSLTFEPKDVIHMPWLAPDPRKLFMGVSPMQLASRDIQINILLTEKIGNYAKNIAIPGLVATKTGTDAANAVEFKDFKHQFQGREGGELSQQAAYDIKKTLKENFADNRTGDALVGKTGWDYKYLGFPLKDWDLENLVKVHQANICSNFRTDPEFIKVSSGLASSTYDNQQTAKLNFFQGVLTSLWRQNDEAMTVGLQPNFGENIRIEHDIASVGVLKEWKNKNNSNYITAINKYQADVKAGIVDREAAISALTWLLGAERREIEPMFPKVLSDVTISPTGITEEARL